MKKLGKLYEAARMNPHPVLAGSLFLIGSVLLPTSLSTVAGALFGAGASLTGAWITEINKRRADDVVTAKRAAEAKRFFAPELKRSIERVLHIHQRADVNFSAAWSPDSSQPTDKKEDFLPERPVLYPNCPQLFDLREDTVAAVIAFYDSLHEIEHVVEKWWEREGQLRANIFNGILHSAHKSLILAERCMVIFDIDEQFPPEYESWGTLSSRITRSLAGEARTRQMQHEKVQANNGEVISRLFKYPLGP